MSRNENSLKPDIYKNPVKTVVYRSSDGINYFIIKATE